MSNQNIDDEWDKFMLDSNSLSLEDNTTVGLISSTEDIPTPSDIYISTKTKISYLDKTVDIDKLFWDLPIINYYSQQEGIIKKQIKFTSHNEKDANLIKNKYTETTNKIDYADKYSKYTILKHIDTSKNTYKHIVKVSFGISDKNILSYRAKEKGVFYNSFTIVYRLYDDIENVYREVNVKIFNTGKLQIPGIKDDHILMKALNNIVKLINDSDYNNTFTTDLNNVETELINSNFNCGYYINRQKLLNILKKKYNLISMFDSCSYPGIQTKFYYNKNKDKQDGVCICKEQCSKKSYTNTNNKCIEISFMIFRTGSVMIVGKCKNDEMLYEIYTYIKQILIDNYYEICEGHIEVNDTKQNKQRMKKRIINITV